MIFKAFFYSEINMLSDILKPENIVLNLESTEQEESIAELVEILVAQNPDVDRSELLTALLAREEQMSTAIYPYVAVPHAVCKGLKKSSLAIGISHSGIEFENPDKSNINPLKVNVIFEVAFDEEDTDGHLHMLRDILQIVSNPDFVHEILLAKNSQEVLNFISTLEN